MRSAEGRAIVVRDGDTMRLGDDEVRLDGIDAPEYRQRCTDAAGRDWPCGEAARMALATLIAGRTITCEEHARDGFGRMVATCRDEDGRDLAAAIAEQGFAISEGRFGNGRYAAEVTGARVAQRGIWAGQFEPPADWRARHPRDWSCDTFALEPFADSDYPAGQ
jgi:endonuclease YncB( thermonuclease family)